MKQPPAVVMCPAPAAPVAEYGSRPLGSDMTPRRADRSAAGPVRQATCKSYRQGFFVGASNPKVALFFVFRLRALASVH